MDKKASTTLVLVLVVICILGYAGTLITVFVKEGLGVFWTLILSIVPLLVIYALITVYRERIKEIDQDEKDDLKKY